MQTSETTSPQYEVLVFTYFLDVVFGSYIFFNKNIIF